MARWRAGSLSTTTSRMGPELRLARLIYFFFFFLYFLPCRLPFASTSTGPTPVRWRRATRSLCAMQMSSGVYWPFQLILCIALILNFRNGFQYLSSLPTVFVDQFICLFVGTSAKTCPHYICRYFVCRALQFPPEAWLRISLKHASITWITIRSKDQSNFSEHSCQTDRCLTLCSGPMEECLSEV